VVAQKSKEAIGIHTQWRCYSGFSEAINEAGQSQSEGVGFPAEAENLSVEVHDSHDTTLTLLQHALVSRLGRPEVL
jgi:hypothetical protein